MYTQRPNWTKHDMRVSFNGMFSYSLPLLPPTPAELRRDSADVPDIFEHQGMYMTPGIFNGMPLPSETPAKLEGGKGKLVYYISAAVSKIRKNSYRSGVSVTNAILG